MTLNLPQRVRSELYSSHDLWTDNLDAHYQFKSVLAPRYWNECSLGVKIHRMYKGRQKRRWSRSYKSLNFK